MTFKPWYGLKGHTADKVSSKERADGLERETRAWGAFIIKIQENIDLYNNSVSNRVVKTMARRKDSVAVLGRLLVLRGQHGEAKLLQIYEEHQK